MTSTNTINQSAKSHFFSKLINIGIFVALLTLVFYILCPFADYYPWIAQGDHGNQLLVFWQTLNGVLPYHGTWYTYGPLMPYYYALSFQLFGISLKSILWAELVIKATTVLVFFFSVKTILRSGIWAFLAAAWFFLFASNFNVSFNHSGALLILATILLLTHLYIDTNKSVFACFSILAFFPLFMIKMNMGIALLAPWTLCLALIDYSHNRSVTLIKNKRFLLSCLLVCFSVVLIYIILLINLPAYQIQRCFPYLNIFKKVVQTGSSNHNSVLELYEYLNRKFSISVFTSVTAKTALVSFFINLALIASRNYFNRKIWLALIMSLACFPFSVHEHFLAPLYSYKMNWGDIFLVSALFLSIYHAVHKFRILKFIVGMGLMACLLFDLKALHFDLNKPPRLSETTSDKTTYFDLFHFAKIMKTQNHFLNVEKLEIYSNNDPSWTSVVWDTTEYLKEHLKEEESFFAFPYDPIYYYLMSKNPPALQTVGFKTSSMPAKVERNLISALENKNVNYFLLSNRAYDNTENEVLGRFGRDYNLMLFKYLHSNFTEIKTYGNWNKRSGWVSNHAVRIYKRKAA